jgi:hypothetical protein
VTNSSKIIIRQTEDFDIDNIVSLANGVFPESEYTRQEVEWLLGSPGENRYNSFVAYEDNTIVGHIGYIISNYILNGKYLTSSHPVLWVVSPRLRGITGIQLLMKIFKVADLNIAISGSLQAREVFSKIGFSHKADMHSFHKVTNIFNYLRCIKGGLRSKTINCLKAIKNSLFDKKNKTDNTEIQFEKADNNTYFKSAFTIYDNKDILINTPSAEMRNWYSKATTVKQETIMVKYKEKLLPPVMIYYKTRPNGARTAIVAEFPHFDNDTEGWKKFISKTEAYLTRQGICAYSILSTSEKFTQAMEKMHFTHSTKPVWIRDKKNCIPDSTELHLTALEGDVAYRSS